MGIIAFQEDIGEDFGVLVLRNAGPQCDVLFNTLQVKAGGP